MNRPDHDQRLLALVGCIHGVVLEFDEQIRYVNVWAEDEALLALPAAELIGRTIEEVLGDAGRAFTARVRRVFETGAPEHLEYPIELADGRRWFLADLSRVTTADAGTTVISVARDITERRAAEDALARSEERYRLAARATNDVLWDWDLASDVVAWNDAGCAVLGVDAVGTGAAWRAGLHVDDRAAVEASLEAALTGDASVWSAHYRHQLADGSHGDFIDRGLITRCPDGRALRMVGSMTDVTRINRLQAQLVQADRLAALGLLAGGIGHEINNPLSYVSGNLEFALELLDAASPAREVVSEALDGARRIAEIVKSLTTLSREDNGDLTMIDVDRVIERAARVADIQIRHRARLVRDLAPVPAIRSSESRLGQVLLNVLANAAQAIPEGAPEAHEIRITTAADADGRVVIAIADTGIGIAPEHLGRVFDPFFTTKPMGEGTGLGLAICHGIVAQLGGEIAVASELGRGTTVSITLPGVTVAPPALPRVLVIDDEPPIGRLVKRMLGGAEVVAVTSAREGLALLRAGRPFDLVLCDVMMPDMSGIDLHDELRRNAPELLARTYFMTGGAFTARSQAFLTAVGRARIDKPLSVTVLRALLAAQQS